MHVVLVGGLPRRYNGFGEDDEAASQEIDKFRLLRLATSARVNTASLCDFLQKCDQRGALGG
jgi:hypothetical protein